MNIFSTHRRKLEPRRRFGGRIFRNKIKQAANYKRTFDPNPRTWLSKILAKVGLASKFWRAFLAVFLIGIVYFLCISTKFVVTQVSVSGNSKVSVQQVQDSIASAGRSRLFFIKKNNFFLLTAGRANQLLKHDILTIKEVVSYQRIWPNQVKIEIKERVPGFVISSNDKYFLVDDEGTVVSQVEGPENMLVVQDQQIESFAAGETLPSQKLAAFVISLSRAWNGKVASPIAAVKFPGKQSSEVQFVSQEGWSVMFDTTRSVVTQLNNLAVLLNKQIAAKDRARLAYIDLRLSKWAYYCFKQTPCGQQALPEDTTAGTTTNAQ